MRSRQEIVARTARDLDRFFRYVKKVRNVHAPRQLEELDRRMGRNTGHVARLLRGDNGMLMKDALKLPAAFGVEPGEFFRDAFGFSVDVYLWELSRQVRWQSQELRRKVRETAREAAIIDDLPRQVTGLEALRFSNPAAAEVQCLEILGAANADLEADCEAWGVLATIYRLRGLFSVAAETLLHALRSARAAESKPLEARVLQRVCYLISDQNDYEQAIEVARRAFHLYTECGDFGEAGKALVDLGIMQDRDGQTDLAITTYKAATGLLPDRAWRSRVALHQGLGLAHLEKEQVESAIDCYDAAVVILEERGSELALNAGILRLRAEIAIRRCDWAAAKSDLRSIRIHWLEGRCPFDLITVSLRLAWVLRACGDIEELRDLARQMASLVGSLGKHEFLEAALTRFVREAAVGGITMETIDGIYRVFKNRGCSVARPNHPPGSV